MQVKNHFAIIRNLRNIISAGIDKKHMDKLSKAFSHESWAESKILPFRYISAARYAPSLEPELETAMFASLSKEDKLEGTTILLVDVSGSMDGQISGKSELTRIDAACGLAMLLREICQKVSIYTFSVTTQVVPPRRGFALRDAVVKSQPHGGTYLGAAVETMNKITYDRLIVISDEQSHDKVPNPKGLGYLINVASYQNGVAYGPWIHCDGWSESIISWIQEYEKL